ncbi:MAG: HAMP domain-containing sensor histidine kinase [Chloroflexota bacterium]
MLKDSRLLAVWIVLTVVIAIVGASIILILDQRSVRAIVLVAILMTFEGLLVALIVATWLNNPDQTLSQHEQSIRSSDKSSTENSSLSSPRLSSHEAAVIAELAHEINNPLTAIRGLAQILSLEDIDPDRAKEPLAQILSNTERIARIVRNLKGDSQVNLDSQGPLDINAVVSDAMALFTAQTSDDQHSVELQLVDNLPMVMGNRHELSRAVINLLTNSRDAVVSAGEQGLIVISSRYNSVTKSVELDVTDNGIGIPLESQGDVFAPFFTTKAPSKGTGVGLTICRRIVEDHSGRIEFESEHNKGSRFTIILPAIHQAQ